MFSPAWRRPSSIQYPKVWSRFEKTTKDGKVLKLKIQDVTEDHHEGILELLIKEFIKEEPWHSNAKFSKDPTSVTLFKEYITKIVFPQKVSIICLLDDEDDLKPEIIGFNCLGICCKDEVDDFEQIIKGKSAATIILLYTTFKKESPDIYNKYNVENYLGAMGLFVKSQYRRLGISTEILKARIPLCKAIDMNISNTIFSVISSQKSARKAGFRVDAVVSYEILRKAAGLEFKNCINCELMTLVVNDINFK